jgi:hypothetical protein
MRFLYFAFPFVSCLMVSAPSSAISEKEDRAAIAVSAQRAFLRGSDAAKDKWTTRALLKRIDTNNVASGWSSRSQLLERAEWANTDTTPNRK